MVAIACVPKVAHTAIKVAALQALGVSVKRQAEVHYHPALRLCQAEKAMAEGYRIFAFVRDPFDRLVSVWASHVLQPRPTFIKKLGARPKERFQRFFQRIDSRAVRLSVHLAPQSEFVPVEATVLRYEALDEGWDYVRTFWPKLPPLQHLNGTKRKETAFYASDAALAACRTTYHEDYRRFGYG